MRLLGILMGLLIAVLIVPLLILSVIGLVSLGIIFVLLLVLGGIHAVIFWIWMLIGCIRNNGLSSNERLIWVLVILFLNVLGAVLYYFFGRTKKRKTVSKKHKRR